MTTYDNIKKIDLSISFDNDELFYTKNYIFNNNEYKIIKYNKDRLNLLQNSDIDSFNILSKFRSIVIRNNKLVLYSPEKSINYDLFKHKYTNTEQCWMEDFIDGTMINVFFDNINNVWEIATKSTIGGDIYFFNDIQNLSLFNDTNNYNNYNNITFRTMFFESCNASNFDLNCLDKKYTYTFVMQHPFNRIVTPVQTPTLYLIKIFDIDNTNFPNVTIIEKNIAEFINVPPYIFTNTNIKFVNKYPISNTLDELYNFYNNDLLPYHCVGFFIYNIDGTRTKIRNKNYEKVRKLRGNQPKLQYNYLCLKKENKIKEFLHYYPEHIILFNKFKLLMFEYTSSLFFNYISCFIKKEKHLKEYEFQYKNHMYHIHQKYITELKPNNKTIDKKFVIDYVNNLHPAQQMFIINYNNNNKNNKTQETQETQETISLQ